MVQLLKYIWKIKKQKEWIHLQLQLKPRLKLFQTFSLYPMKWCEDILLLWKKILLLHSYDNDTY